MRLVIGIAVLALAVCACNEDLGSCDSAVAQQLVWTPDGTPYTEGQALIHFECANGVCHARAATGTLRRGAPHGVDFDLAPLTPAVTGAQADTQLIALREGILEVRRDPDDIYSLIRSGDMPPEAPAGARTLPTFRRQDGSTVQLPKVASGAGTKIVRNWLACGQPFVAATEGVNNASADELANSVDGVPVLAAQVEATFDSIYNAALSTTCVACHVPGGPYSALDLTSADAAYTALVNQPVADVASDPCAGMGIRVVPGNCQASLLYQKLAPNPSCGLQMPQGGPFANDATLSALCAWIDAGAAR